MGKLNNDEAFRHINYHATDLRRTFARVRREQKEKAALAQAEREAAQKAIESKVRKLRT